ncbi:MAG: monofunctional biosynthetic peptidoglycan transglycosylase [Gemmatimonadota bacterium]|nr:monofunctional biosynthetic peptidoglycan transglycosylase [Gemmatimonadota bacterium]MDH4348863.1 monofunctional biosynthetic peptidoglycan transglycosylase [Gemmatimonadota bacterium]MDH5196311.1 monofunctional biosynthetic peptidoglycan transglycosylase [Gemmatimonadota bacterium]
MLATGVVGTRLWLRWPDVAAVAVTDPVQSALMARAAAEGVVVRHSWVHLDEITPQLALAVLVAEDIEFFQHRGFSFAEIRVAMAEARDGTRVRGASTITQQLAKNLWLSSDRTVVRKVQEAVLAADLERFLAKRRILELYLNVAQFGPGVFGAEAAAQRFFGKPALFLTEDESAQLAAGLSRPSLWHPGVSTPDYADRVQLIRRRMTNAEFLWRHLLNI